MNRYSDVNESDAAFNNASLIKFQSTEDTSKQHFHGHRQRLRKRFDEAGTDAMADYELLELLLYRFVPRQDTKPIAKDLLNQFGSLAAVLGAEQRDLTAIKNVGQQTARDLKVVRALFNRTLKTELRDRKILSSWSSVINYCNATMAHEKIEQFRILFLDKKNVLIKDEVQQKGTIDHTPVYPREVIKRSLELASSSIILVHNHPSGDPTPSRADIETTKTIVEAAALIGIDVHDHIIIGQDGHVSMKALQLI